MAPAAGGGELEGDRDRVSVWEGGQLLVTEGGDDRTTAPLCSRARTYTN